MGSRVFWFGFFGWSMRFIQHDCVKYVETGRKISARCVFEKKQKIYARFFLFSGRNLAFLKDVSMITQQAPNSHAEPSGLKGYVAFFSSPEAKIQKDKYTLFRRKRMCDCQKKNA